MDQLISLLPRFGFDAALFFRGPFCGENLLKAAQGHGHLHLVRSGQVAMHHPDGSVLQVEGPELVFYPRPVDHRLAVPPGGKAELLCADVRFRHAERNPVALSLPPVMRLRLDEAPGLSSVLSIMFEESSHVEIGGRLVLDRLCDILIVHLVRHALRHDLIAAGVLAGLWDARLAPVLAGIHNHPEREHSIEEMACEAHMSRTAFANHFRSVVGVPPAEYIAGWRMALSQACLVEGKAVKEVAAIVGYRTQPAFTRAFVARYGMAPTEWLRTVRQPAPDSRP
ncbi:MAG TPA: AraC family transcriptional regulator [Noviherbaspirillum sp.]|jgi:AraC-like DNA-binding protein|uniref:AraC family transcriptional regulator n=1 Tax=Noviherbaspirillum sp. TaxID=1926288 RepID=UPI002F949345